MVEAQPPALRVACSELIDVLSPGEVGVIHAYEGNIDILAVAVVTLREAIAVATEAGGDRIIRRLQCELPPCGHAWTLLLWADGLHLLGLPLAPKPNAPGGSA